MENASREAYLRGSNSLKVRAYRRMLERILVELGVDETTAEMDAKDVVDFEMQLANVRVSSSSSASSSSSSSQFLLFYE